MRKNKKEIRRIRNYINVSNLYYLLSHPKALKESFFIIYFQSRFDIEAAKCFAVSPQHIQNLLDELYEKTALNLKDRNKSITAKKQGLKLIGIEWLYIAVRLLKPTAILETGVSDGDSSAIILSALDTNKNGHLYSIDISKFLFDGKEVGWKVPPELRSRWSLYIGESVKVMQTLLPKLGQINIFLHDSDHSYSNMLNEFNLVYPYINPGGLLMADDINRNNAFSEFCQLKNINSQSKNKYFGILLL